MRIAIEYLTETTRDLLLMQVQHIRMQNGALVVTYSENDIKTSPYSKTN
jgi:hypothetical protein